MVTITDRGVVVRARTLDDLLELVARAAERLPDTDPLTSALRGVAAEVRADAYVD